jgi:hypothetical protein
MCCAVPFYGSLLSQVCPIPLVAIVTLDFAGNGAGLAA